MPVLLQFFILSLFTFKGKKSEAINKKGGERIRNISAISLIIMKVE